MTATELSTAIDEVFAKRGMAAAQSEYDRSVCVRAIATARGIFEDLPVEGNTADFGQAVISALSPIYENYNDPDGEYTSGKGTIGDVIHDIRALIFSHSNDKANEDAGE
jgi:hypothetical protein